MPVLSLQRIAATLAALGTPAVVGACAGESNDGARAATASTASTVPSASASAMATATATPVASASVTATVDRPCGALPPTSPRPTPSLHGTCCKGPRDCGSGAVCSRYPFHIASMCPTVCVQRCTTQADCPPTPGGVSNLMCGSGGLCVLPGPGN